MELETAEVEDVAPEAGAVEELAPDVAAEAEETPAEKSPEDVWKGRAYKHEREAMKAQAETELIKEQLKDVQELLRSNPEVVEVLRRKFAGGNGNGEKATREQFHGKLEKDPLGAIDELHSANLSASEKIQQLDAKVQEYAKQADNLRREQAMETFHESIDAFLTEDGVDPHTNVKLRERIAKAVYQEGSEQKLQTLDELKAVYRDIADTFNIKGKASVTQRKPPPSTSRGGVPPPSRPKPPKTSAERQQLLDRILGEG